MAIEWYLYGGYKLPKFPEIEGCPYITLSESGSYYQITFAPVPFYDFTYDSGNYNYRTLVDTSFYEISVAKSKIENWTISSSYSITGPTKWGAAAAHFYNYNYLWSNYNMLSYKDNSLVHTGSDPILYTEITSITINSPNSINKGSFITISALVVGEENSNLDYILTLAGEGINNTQTDMTALYKNTSGDKTIYQLYCSKTETAENLIITATSIVNPSITASKTIAVIGVNNQSDIMLIQKQTLTNIADAIRNKNKTTKTYSPFEMIQGIEEIQTGYELEELANPATAQQILSGYEAYNSNGEKISGSAFLTGGYVEVKLLANNWNGTTQTVSINNFRIADGQTPLMDLPYNSSAPNAIRVVEAAITMPSIKTTSSTANGVTSYTTTCIFSAVTTPPVDVVVAIFNITEVAI